VVERGEREGRRSIKISKQKVDNDTAIMARLDLMTWYDFIANANARVIVGPRQRDPNPNPRAGGSELWLGAAWVMMPGRVSRYGDKAAGYTHPPSLVQLSCREPRTLSLFNNPTLTPGYALVHLVPSAGIWSASRSRRCRFRRLQGQEGARPRTLHHPLANFRRLFRPQSYTCHSARRPQESSQGREE
jgi:hypothetical protein